jgi:hypothetical protein
LNVTIHRSVEEIENLRASWENLQHHPNSDISIYLDSLSSRKNILQPYIITIGENGKTNTILIGRIEEKKIYFTFGYKSIYGPKLKYLAFNYGGLLGQFNKEDSIIIIKTILKSLKQKEADVVFFNHLSNDSDLYYSALHQPNIFVRQYFSRSNPHWSMPLPGTKEEIKKLISSKLQSQLRKLPRDYPDGIKIHKFSTPDDLDRMMKEIEIIAKKTYHRGMGTGFLNDRQTYYRLKTAAKNGWLRAYILYVDSKPCVFNTGIKYGDSFFGEFTGYDSAFNKYSPGMYLFMKVFEDLVDEQVKVVDFGFGDALYKQRLGKICKTESTVLIFSKNIMGLYLNFMSHFSSIFNYVADTSLKKINLLIKIKRFWRNLLMTKATKTTNKQLSSN